MEQVKAPTPAQIDALVNDYAAAMKVSLESGARAKVDKDAADALKARVTEMVEVFGQRKTDASKWIKGHHTTATTTTGKRTCIDDAAVEKLRVYLEKQDLPELTGRFFVAHTTYTLVDGPGEVLKTLTLGGRIRNRIQLLLGMCFQIRTNNPSLKIEVVTPEEPARG